MGIIFWLSAQPQLPRVLPVGVELQSVVGHLAAYFVLAALWWRPLRRLGLCWAVIGVLLIATLYGISDELHQATVPNRVADIRDVLTDLAGAAIAVTALWWLQGRRRTRRN